MRRVSVDHELLRRAVADPEVLHWHTWAALAPGPSLVVLGAVHGNEVCGAHAIVRAIDDLTHGRLRLLRGRLTLVPVAHPLAFAQAPREGQRHRNRRFLPQPDPQDYEDRITHQLAPLLAQHEVLLDLHSFHTPGDPFAMVGPRNNSGAREPFARAAEEMALARALGAQQVVEGWLEVYDRAARAATPSPSNAASTKTRRPSTLPRAPSTARWRTWSWCTCSRHRALPARPRGSRTWCCVNHPPTGWRRTGTASTPCRPAT